jgi:NAD+ synthase
MKINEPFVEKILTAFIKEELGLRGFKKAILGFPGPGFIGLRGPAARALSPKNVIGLRLPYGKGFGGDFEDARNCPDRRRSSCGPSTSPQWSTRISRAIRPASAFSRQQNGPGAVSILFDQSAGKALILGTSNKTELLIGYGTIHGDLACAVNPMGYLYKTQVRALAVHLGSPSASEPRRPRPALAGHTDEKEIGLTLRRARRDSRASCRQPETPEEVAARGFAVSKVDRVLRLIRRSEFKRQMPPTRRFRPERSARLSLSLSMGSLTALPGRCTLSHADRQPGRHHLPGGPHSEGGGHRPLRGHAANPQAPQPL